MDERRRAITVFHLLNMNSGLACDDRNSASPGSMYPSQDKACTSTYELRFVPRFRPLKDNAGA